MQPGVNVVKSVYAEIILPLIGPTTIMKFTLDNGFMSVDTINYGATIIAINVPNKEGEKENILLHHEDIHGYLNMKNPYYGATIGRYGHRIAGAVFNHKNQNYFLSKNDGCNTFHGGVQGFDKKLWDSRVEENTVLMTYKSYDLEEGFPGDLNVSVRFILTNRNQLIVVYKALPVITTPVNIMNQLFFNLGGSGKANVLAHEVKIYSQFKALVTPKEHIPTGEVEEIVDTPLDLRKYTPLTNFLSTSGRPSAVDPSSMAPDRVTVATRDTTEYTDFQSDGVSVSPILPPTFFCIEGLGVRPNAKLKYEPSGRAVQIFSDQPCLLLSLGSDLSEATRTIAKRARGNNDLGILLQTGNFPDAVHHDEFPSPWVQPQTPYLHTIIYKFRVSGLDCSDDEDGEAPTPEVPEEEARMKCFNIKENEPQVIETSQTAVEG